MIEIEMNKNKIKICDEVTKAILKYVQYGRNDTEAGGIIIGRENLGNSNIILEFITEPMGDDIRTRTSYIRKDLGHIEYYNRLYFENNGVYAYYGEWHTHPEDFPNYSIIDLINWNKIARHDPKGVQYHLIAGRKAVVIWEMRKKYLRPKVLREVKWSEILK